MPRRSTSGCRWRSYASRCGWRPRRGRETSSLVLAAVNRRGRAVRCEVRVMPLFSARHGLFGAIVLMHEVG